MGPLFEIRWVFFGKWVWSGLNGWSLNWQSEFCGKKHDKTIFRLHSSPHLCPSRALFWQTNPSSCCRVHTHANRASLGVFHHLLWFTSWVCQWPIRLSTGGSGRSRRVKLEILMMVFRLRLPEWHSLCIIGKSSGIHQLLVMSLTNASACCGGSQTHPPSCSKSKQQVFFFRKTF